MDKMTSILVNCLLWILLFQDSVISQDTSYYAEYDDDDRPQVFPTFISHEQNFKVRLGDKVLLPCEVDNLHDLKLVWKKGDAVLTAGNMKLKPLRRFNLVGTSLEINNVRLEDAGEYICQIPTSPIKEQFHTVEILTPPSIRSSLGNGEMSVRKGDPVTLSCEAHGNPKPDVTWTREAGSTLLPNGMSSYRGPTLSIQKTDRKHTGKYRCTAENGVGDPAVAEVNLHVMFPPEISVDRNWISTGVGYDAQMTCEVHAEPRADVNWLVGGRRVESTRHVPRFEARHNKHVLTVKNVQVSDFGNYSCVANNSLGTARHNIELTGVPNQPVFRGSQSGYDDSSYVLTWEVESYSPIIEYKLLYRRLGHDHNGTTSEWKHMIIPLMKYDLKSPKHVKSFTLKDLAPDSYYEAVVLTQNKHGWSKQSDYFEFSTATKKAKPLSDSGYKGPHAVADLAASSTYSVSITTVTLLLLVTLLLNTSY